MEGRPAITTPTRSDPTDALQLRDEDFAGPRLVEEATEHAVHEVRARRGSLFTIPLVCLGLAVLAACLLIPAVDQNRRMAYDREQLRRDLAQLDQQIAVNLRAPFLLTRALLPAMKARRRGRIVHVGSISSTIGSANAAVYAASKWGLVGLMKSLAEELRDSGLSTVAVLPGSVDTEMLAGSGFAPRMRAEDVASALVYHALDASHAHNGGVIEMFGV